MITKKITADFETYWHIGTGRGSGNHLDALVETDAQGLPYVPGKTFKGLLRDAVFQAESLGWFADYPFNTDQKYLLTDLIFGQRALNSQEEQTRFDIQPGMIRVSNLNPEDQAWLLSQEGESLKPLVFREIYSTAIDTQTGTAKDKSLRGQQVTIPMKLLGEIQFMPPLTQDDFAIKQGELLQNEDVIDYVLKVGISLVRSIGANKTRGFGRVTLEVA